MNKSALIESAKTYIQLNDNWNSYGAIKISQETIDAAIKVIEWLPEGDWFICPCEDDSIQIERHEKGFDVEIFIQSTELAENDD